LPIFTAGLIEADVREAWSQFRQALLFRQYLFRQIDRDIRTAYENVVNSDERIRELRVQLTAAEQALRQAEESYGAGLATNLERITAQDQVLSAQLQLASEEFNRKLFYLNLLRAAGGLRNELDRAATTQPV